jgi:hypothetical protein
MRPGSCDPQSMDGSIVRNGRQMKKLSKPFDIIKARSKIHLLSTQTHHVLTIRRYNYSVVVTYPDGTGVLDALMPSLVRRWKQAILVTYENSGRRR